jgi:phage terminase small subunit
MPLMKIISLFRQFCTAQRELPEPAWSEVLSNADEHRAAAGYWRSVATALQARGNIDPVNCHAILRLVVAYIVCDRASADVMRSGAPVDVQAWNVQLAASQLAGQIESDLGLSPRRRCAT